jgi:mono/diheme cytochrome c family protein
MINSTVSRLLRGSAFLISFVVYADRAEAQELFPSSSLSQGWRFDEKGGAALYAHVCAACHQPDANGAAGAAAYPALAADKNLASAEYMEGVLLSGLRGMPPVGRLMNDEQIADVINYVRSHFGNAYEDPLSASDVRAVRPK